ncbi:MAG: hypothetical protein BRC24_02205 [Parcubacteria group bacterium SW_4_46_8]|nr:MAG: hypothetical protein BRC24_02205 [Parcubacteria group bacterium SW_4_46_8]
MWTIAILFTFGIGVFAYYQSAALIRGPVVVITAPTNGKTFTSAPVTVKGTASHISYLSLNGRQIFTDTDGVFAERLLLAPGYNIITITAEDKFDRTRTKTLELVYTDKETNQ